MNLVNTQKHVFSHVPYLSLTVYH